MSEESKSAQKNRSVEFFDRQFARQVEEGHFALNPFEQAILPFLAGDVLDLGCGLGNLAVRAARQGCRVTALDASPAAIGHLARHAAAKKLAIAARQADLVSLDIQGEFDCAVAIGLLMFFPQEAAQTGLMRIKGLVKPGGLAAVNVLIEGTTFMDMFDPSGYYLFRENELPEAFEGWTREYSKVESFPVPKDTLKRFCTLVARRPVA
ncbi:MAG TPA: class I SAM-dependent methyltransferase [Terriglobia bacterium]|nr:class I SAM-dependent methyltransferase [Terriglobia bacterium]